MKAKEWLISLISGLIGVIVGSIIQLIFEHISIKNQIRQEYKKENISEWLNLRSEIRDLFSVPNERNNLYFRQIFLLKVSLLNSIGNTKKSKENVKKLVDKLKNDDERISLEGTAEKAFSIGSKDDDKKKIEIEIFNIINNTIGKIQEI